jgi:serine/threonine protein kinase
MNKIVSHYRLLEKIGEGGMGVVYKAEDTKLKRTVALKFLPPELTRDSQAKARFAQEAQAAAALDHPNICAVFEIGEAEGATYIAMPYVKGRSLKERIAAGPLSMEEALDIAGQVAEGLKEAHERGIIHRDIKPANIMLTEKGHAKIMDFGLAKLEAGVDLTKTMAVMGTVAYMSPEQARGEEVDLRTDIWSFGATLYEMLTGQKPFGQKHDQALLYSVLNDTMESVSRICPEIPNHLERVIQKALEKDKFHRYQNMAELLKDLKSTRVSGLTVPKAEKSIIVLPFENISPDPEQEYFCDGMTEEIITDLSHVHNLLVISRSSAIMLVGKVSAALPLVEKYHKIDPVNPNCDLLRGLISFFEGHFDLAAEDMRVTYEMVPHVPIIQFWYALSLAYNKRFQECAWPYSTATRESFLQMMPSRN